MAAFSQPMTFAVIEDNVDLCHGWRELLGIDGHQVHCYYTGSDALDNIDTLAKCHVIVSDYYLPDVNGIDLINKIRAAKPNLPAVLLTGSKDPAIRESIERLKNAVLVHKPLGIDDLEAAVKSVLDITTQ